MSDHDLGECFTGDIPTFKKTEKDEQKEEQLLREWVDRLPMPFQKEMADLYAEMEERKTVEAKIYKALDNLEAVLQHNESDLATWVDHEYELTRNYGNDKVQFSEYLKALREKLREETDEKIGEGIKMDAVR